MGPSGVSEGEDWKQRGSLVWCGYDSGRHDEGYSELCVRRAPLVVRSGDLVQEACGLETTGGEAYAVGRVVPLTLVLKNHC